MAQEFKFPDVGEGLSEGKLVSWKVKVGDTITVDQVLAEVETDKAVVEIPSPYAGIITTLHNQEGDTITVGDVIVTFDGDDDPVQETVLQKTTEHIVHKETVSKEKVLAMPAVFKMARDHHIDLSLIHPTGNSGQITMDDLHYAADSSHQAILSKIPAQETVQEEPKPVNPIPKLEKKEVIKETTTHEFVMHNTKDMGNLLNSSFATPKVRRHARKLGVDIHRVKGTGPKGIILETDIDKVAGTIQSEGSEVSRPEHVMQAPSVAPKDVDEVQPMTTIRKIIASRMRESQDNVAEVTHIEEVDMTNLFNLRAKEKPAFEKLGVKLTYLPFIVKAVLGALEKFPYFNATIKEDTIILKKHYNIGIAVDTPHGLMVPVIKDADKKSIVDISKEIAHLAGLARDRKIQPTDVSDGSFTITSVGNLGGVAFTPIINYPEVAVLGIAKIRDEPKIINNHIYARKIMNLCLTFDHRVVDGADAARFCSLLKAYLEDPQRLFMETI